MACLKRSKQSRLEVQMRNLRVIVLAAERKGVANPLALRFATSHKCLIPLCGQPLITHVLETLSAHPCVASIIISIEQDAIPTVRAVLPSPRPDQPEIGFAPAADSIADSVIAAALGHDGPLLITTADNALLQPASMDAMYSALLANDVGIAMARRDAVLAAHPEGQRRFYRFRDDQYSNCNLYGLAGGEALSAAEIFRGGGQFARNASRIVDAFGLLNLLLLRMRLIALDTGLQRISRRIGLRIAPVILDDGSQAIDVDNDRTYAIVEQLLQFRARSGIRAAA
jgi:GTP:adenosylcobinamide-phosphate guanylyltransferase